MQSENRCEFLAIRCRFSQTKVIKDVAWRGRPCYLGALRCLRKTEMVPGKKVPEYYVISPYKRFYDVVAANPDFPVEGMTFCGKEITLEDVLA